uniref:Uncharacterized protein n=1 Tax=Knipowitschia caucasica TaxID=637954 RepID=A0AAV2MHR1_KNICA
MRRVRWQAQKDDPCPLCCVDQLWAEVGCMAVHAAAASTPRYLQHNRIQDVNPDAFRGLYNLTRLYISHNRISVLKPGVFRDLHKLEWL